MFSPKDLPPISSIGHMMSSSECYQMCIISRGWHGDTASAPCIHVTQLISELLKSVCCEGVIVVQNVIVCRSACSLRRNQQGKIIILQPASVRRSKCLVKNKDYNYVIPEAYHPEAFNPGSMLPITPNQSNLTS